jgi:hypothetical protein
MEKASKNKRFNLVPFPPQLRVQKIKISVHVLKESCIEQTNTTLPLL